MADVVIRRLKRLAYWALGILPDRAYVRLHYRRLMGAPLRLRDPKTFSEKLQWLKLYDRQPLYTTLVDKFAVKEWVSARIGEEHVIPTLHVWNSAEEVDFE